MEEDFSKLSKEELVALAQQLEEEVGDLTKENQLLKRGARGEKNVDAGTVLELGSFSQETEDLREKHAQSAKEIARFKEQTSNSAEARDKRVDDEKWKSDSNLEAAHKRIETLEKEVLDATSNSRMKDIQINEAEKQNIATIEETKRLFEENDRLRDEVLFSFLIVACALKSLFCYDVRIKSWWRSFEITRKMFISSSSHKTKSRTTSLHIDLLQIDVHFNCVCYA